MYSALSILLSFFIHKCTCVYQVFYNPTNNYNIHYIAPCYSQYTYTIIPKSVESSLAITNINENVPRYNKCPKSPRVKFSLTVNGAIIAANNSSFWLSEHLVLLLSTRFTLLSAHFFFIFTIINLVILVLSTYFRNTIVLQQVYIN